MAGWFGYKRESATDAKITADELRDSRYEIELKRLKREYEMEQEKLRYVSKRINPPPVMHPSLTTSGIPVKYSVQPSYFRNKACYKGEAGGSVFAQIQDPFVLVRYSADGNLKVEIRSHVDRQVSIPLNLTEEQFMPDRMENCVTLNFPEELEVNLVVEAREK